MMTETDVNHESSINSINVPVPVVNPRNAEEFRSLCDALQRNDPNVTSISTSHLSMIAGGYGRELGHALQRNTVVSTIDLSLSYLIARFSEPVTFCPKIASERMALLLHWMENSCSLRNVKVGAGWNRYHTDLILEPLMVALVKHGNIQNFEVETFPISLRLLTPFLQANSLKTLKLRTTRNPGNDIDDVDDVYEGCARAVGALHQLESLTIGTSQVDPFLRQLTTSPALHTTLRELTLNFCEQSLDWNQSGAKFQAGALCRVLCDKSCRLERLELTHLHFCESSWTLVSSALLRSNPSSPLRSLVLFGVVFSEEAARLFLRDMQSSPVPSSSQPPLDEQPQAPTLHHILDLRLTSCIFDTRRPAMKLGHMLCGSLLQHITLDLNNLRPQQDFFDVLTTRGTASCLLSMHLLNIEWNDLRRLAPYISTTVYLRDLIVQCADGEQDGVMPVPNVFLSSLRQNGSLHQVDLSSVRLEYRYTPNEASARRIQAYTTRNRVLPQLMATTSFGSRTTLMPIIMAVRLGKLR